MLHASTIPTCNAVPCQMTSNFAFASVAPGRKPQYHRQHGVCGTPDIHILKIRDRTHLPLVPRDNANYEHAPPLPGMFFVPGGGGGDLLVHFHYVAVPTENIYYFLLCCHHWQPVYPYVIFTLGEFPGSTPENPPPPPPLEFLTSM